MKIIEINKRQLIIEKRDYDEDHTIYLADSLIQLGKEIHKLTKEGYKLNKKLNRALEVEPDSPEFITMVELYRERNCQK